MQIVAEMVVFLYRFSDDSGWKNRIFSVVDLFAVEDREFMVKAVVAVVIAKGAFDASFMRRRFSEECKFGFGDKGMGL